MTGQQVQNSVHLPFEQLRLRHAAPGQLIADQLIPVFDVDRQDVEDGPRSIPGSTGRRLRSSEVGFRGVQSDYAGPFGATKQYTESNTDTHESHTKRSPSGHATASPVRLCMNRQDHRLPPLVCTIISPPPAGDNAGTLERPVGSNAPANHDRFNDSAAALNPGRLRSIVPRSTQYDRRKCPARPNPRPGTARMRCSWSSATNLTSSGSGLRGKT